MRKVLLIGNPNVGKTTLFNTLTKSSEHTGNFHGVTVESKSKVIKLEKENFQIIDLPGIYSLNTFTHEEDITKQQLLKEDAINLVLADCNSLRKNLYLCLQMQELNLSYKLLLNNYDYFLHHKNKLNLNKLKQILNVDLEIINAKKLKINSNFIKITKKENNQPKYLFYFINKIKNKYILDEKTIILALNGEFKNLNKEQIKFIKSLNEELVKARYKYIDNILKDCVEYDKSFVYGYSKLDKVILNPVVMLLGFLAFFLASVYVIFFLVGPFLTDKLTLLMDLLLINPINNFILSITDNIWIIEFFSNGVFNSFTTILSFLPQVSLMFVFISLLEDSGLISRLCYVLDDFLTKLGLNGKAVYIILLGLGCNTMSTMATRSINGTNLRIKSAIINPYISCMARLPVYVLIASAMFGYLAYFVVAGLYLLGITVALILAFVLNKTILKTESGELLLEFAPLRNIDCKHIAQVALKNAGDLFKRVFSVVLCVGIIVWILTHTQFNLKYTQDITESVLFAIANLFAFIFAPIGLNNAGIVTALIVGVMAKELILSTMSITNNATKNGKLMASLLLTTSVIHFNVASAVSFLIFSALYCPCISNLAVLKKETGTFYMWFAIISQFTIAYMLSFIAYQALTKGWLFAILIIFVIILIVISIVFAIKKVKQHKCLTCGKCKN